MVTQRGMSEVLGRLRYSENEEQVFLGKEINNSRDYSEEKSKLIDDEVAEIVSNAESNALHILNTHISQLHNISKVLLDKETITGKEMADVIENGIPVIDEQATNDVSTNKPKRKRRSSNKT